MAKRQRILIASAFSAAGRYSMLWLAAAGLGLVFDEDRTGFIVFLAAIVAEWALTNAPIKMLFQRRRPDNSSVIEHLPSWLKPPRSSSFPSGHSSAAAFATVIFAAWEPVAGIIAAAGAAVMAWSRVEICAHHRTDVAAGLAWGALLGFIGLTLFRSAFPQ